MANEVEHLFLVLICHLNILSAEVSVQICCPFLLGSLFFIFKIYLFYLFLAALDLRYCAQASHCGGLSCCRALALGTRASVFVACGLSLGSRAQAR